MIGAHCHFACTLDDERRLFRFWDHDIERPCDVSARYWHVVRSYFFIKATTVIFVVIV
jgi:hypothetical protein